MIKKNISFVTENAIAYRGVIFPPINAFEYIIQNLISDLEEPVIECVKLVMDELLTAVQKATCKVCKKNCKIIF